MKFCYWSIDKLPGLSEADQVLLQNSGITNTLQLLEKTKTLQLKQGLAGELQINIQNINKWVALADLARIPSVGYQYCGLLLHSGIASVAQLMETPIHRLHRQMLRLQVATMQRPDLCPPVEMVQKWFDEARFLKN